MECFFFWFDGCSFDHDSNASWVQAIGSVLAILVAIWIPRRDRKDSELAADEKVLRSFSSVVDELRHANSLLLKKFAETQEGHHAIKRRDVALIYYKATEPMVQALLKIPITDLPDPQLITFAIQATECIEEIESAVIVLWPEPGQKSDIGRIPEVVGKFEKVLTSVEGVIQSCRQALQKRAPD